MTIFIGITLMMIVLNSNLTISNVEEVSDIHLKIQLEALAFNVVGNTNVKRQVSDTYKIKNNLEYMINNYEDNYIIYVRDPNNLKFTYYLIFNNLRTNSALTDFIIYKEGYLRGDIDEL